MSGVQGMDQLNVTFGTMLAKASNRLLLFKEVAFRLAHSVQKNFEKGGRPERWKISKRARRESGQTLLRTGRLMRSVSMPTINAQGIEFGSNLPYAAIHQFGGEIQMPARSELFRHLRISRGRRKGKFKKGTEPGRGFTRSGYTIRMPARPYIVFQSEDVEDTGRIILSHLL